MSANIIIFDCQYITEEIKNINKAKRLTEEAINLIKKATQHRNWLCNETAEIDNSLNTISNRLQRLNTGIERTGSALSKGLTSFSELEKRSESQANSLSNNLQSNYGFSASGNDKNNSVLPITIIPTIPVGKLTVAVLVQWFKELQDRIKKFWENFWNKYKTSGGTKSPATSTTTTTETGTGSTSGKSSSNSSSSSGISTGISEGNTISQPVSPTGNTVQNNETPQQTIWDFFYDKIGNEYGVAALMGNLKAESGLNSNNLQNSYENSFGMNDDSYTQAVDSGSYDNFVEDSAGYGIAQWTYYTRKQALLDFAREKGTSVGNLQTQMEFLWKELSESYTGVLNALKNATSIREASDIVLKEFERPADQSEAVCIYRASEGENFYNEMHAV